MVFELGEQGFTRAEQELGVRVKRADVLLPPETVIEEAAAAEDGPPGARLQRDLLGAVEDRRAGLFVPPTALRADTDRSPR